MTQGKEKKLLTFQETILKIMAVNQQIDVKYHLVKDHISKRHVNVRFIL